MHGMTPPENLKMASCKNFDTNAGSMVPLPGTSPAVGVLTKDDHQASMDLDKKLSWLKPFLQQPGGLRKFLGPGFRASAVSVDNSKSFHSAADAAATSRAAERAFQYIDEVLQDAPHVMSDLGFLPFKQKVDAMPLSRLSESDFRRFRGSQDQWQLIKVAITASVQAYEQSDATFQAKGDRKATIVRYERVHGQNLLIVAIRGSASLDAWMQNINGAPQTATDGNLDWHTGFTRSAKAMEEQISEKISSLKRERNSIDTILFTGHSAGGAIAQIFYAMSFTPNRRLWRVVSSFSKVHCIIFGAPPIVSSPMHSLADSSLFLSIVNEGDLVALLQEEHFKTLLSVYMLPAEEVDGNFPSGFVVPSPILRASGTCVVLRDRDPDDPDEDGVDAVEVAAVDLEKKLFGNPFVHLKKVYLARVEWLAAEELERFGQENMDEAG